MNKIKTLILILLIATTTFYGQRRPDREKIKSLKVAYITEKLDLSSKEAEVFWPIYNEHEKSQENLRKKERVKMRSKDWDFTNVSDKDLKEYIELQLWYKDEKHKLEMAFFKNVTQKLSPKKALRLIKAEQNFHRHLIKQYRQRRDGGGGFR